MDKGVEAKLSLQHWFSASTNIRRGNDTDRPRRRKHTRRGLLATMHQVALDIAYESTIDEEVAIAFAQLGEGDRPDAAFLGELHRRITERLVAPQDPSRALNLSRPLASEDVLDRIQQALRALPAERNKRRDAGE
jgi:hypothetical protein